MYMNKQYCMITTTFDNKQEAENVINILLEKRLVSCCQLSNISSKYHWKGNIEIADEYIVHMKSKKVLYKEIESEILKLHSYEVPQIVMYDIQDGYKQYLEWIDNETK
ncbi:MAG: divalent-cation tolerance protein CutA [Clostridiales bacterium]|nr:divalent-cation tolerance protein CutA [Clostridiales bacterium]